MKKIYAKLILITVTLLMSVSVVAMSTYAWFVLSKNPVATGIQVAIGGGNTILIAPDITEVVNGTVYHYPGKFSDKMNFAQYESYDYLKDLGGLNPVSTIDGINWFLPTYYSVTDEEVQEGKVISGSLRDCEDFILDDKLTYANLQKTDTEKIEEGSYIYLDFWVVAPEADYTLRLSTPVTSDDDSGGSFVVDLLQPTSSSDGTGCRLIYPDSMAAAAVRVGFLANSTGITDDTMLYYQDSSYFDERYTSLQGIYYEAGITADQENNRFTIYEPNADSHPTGIAASGSYVATKPIALLDGVPTAVSISDRVTVQKTSSWTKAESGAGTAIEQRFQAALLGMNLTDMEEQDIMDAFYGTYLQGQISPYVTKGAFIKKTSDLYKFGSSATAEELASLDSKGATEDVYIIKLERNVPQRIRMFIWLEGQDVDCVDSVRSSSFAVNIELAGGTQ